MIRPQYPHPRPIAVDLFSGAGGMSLGFEQAGFDVVLAVDRDGYHTATHKRNFPNCVTLCRSVVGLTGEEIRRLAQVRGEVDLVFGGPPCQGFSHMGLRDVGDPRNTLVDEFARIVSELRPRAFVMENVPGMQSGKTRPIFERVVETFQRAGYKITWPVRTLNAMNFGVPQNRERLFVLGLREDVPGTIEYPTGPSEGQPSRPTVLEAIEDLPEVERYDFLFERDWVPYEREPAPSNRYAMVMRGLLVDPSDASRPRECDRSICTGCLRVRHREDVQALYAATPPGEMVPGHKLPRLNPNGIAPTLRAGSESERGSHTAPRPIHPLRPRCITAREAARLHGFPDWFAFYPAKWHAYRQIGNAVCPPVARNIGRSILKTLGAPISSEAPESIVLRDTFVLPEDRPKNHRRIPQLEEYPKVLNFLFNEAFDRDKEALRKARFSIKDVERAIRTTGANLPRTTPERILLDVARSRNVTKMLALPLRHGYSILPLADGDALGEFVPRGTPGTLEDKDVIQIKSDHLMASMPLRSPTVLSLEDPSDLLEIVRLKKVLEDLFGEGETAIEFERDLFGVPARSVIRFSLGRQGKASKPGCVILTARGSLPHKSRVARILADHGSVLGVLVTPLTFDHVFVAAFAQQRDSLKLLKRIVYHLENADGRKPAKRRASESKSSVPGS